MSQFRQLTDRLWASPQITVDDIAEAARLGITAVINNRPEGESPDQSPGDEIEAAARAAGMSYTAIPVTPGGFTREQVAEMQAATAGDAKTLAYCRSGTRSTLLWALARSAAGDDAEELANAAAEAGYDLAPVRGLMDQLRGGN